MENVRQPFSPLKQNANVQGQHMLGGGNAKDQVKDGAKRVISQAVRKTPAKENMFKLTVSKTPTKSAKKLERMRSNSLNMAARAEAQGDFWTAQRALCNVEGTPDAKALRSLQKRMSHQASCRKDSRGKEASSVAQKLDEVLNDLESKDNTTPQKSTPVSDTTSCEDAHKFLGSAKKLAVVRATKIQEQQLGTKTVSTPVRRSYRYMLLKDVNGYKSDSNDSSALNLASFAYTPNRFVNAPMDFSSIFDNASEDEAEEENASTPVMSAAMPEAQPVSEVPVTKAATPKTAIAKVIATIMNATLDENKAEAVAEQKEEVEPAHVDSAATLFECFKSPMPEQKEEASVVEPVEESVSKSVSFARSVEEDGSIDHKICDNIEELQQELEPVNIKMTEEVLEDASTFHSGLTPKAPEEEAVVEQVEAPTIEEESIPVEEVLETAEEVAVVEAPKEVVEEKAEPKSKSSIAKAPVRRSSRKKSVSFEDTVKVEEEAPARRTTRSRAKKTTTEAPAAPVRRSSRLSSKKKEPETTTAAKETATSNRRVTRSRAKRT